MMIRRQIILGGLLSLSHGASSPSLAAAGGDASGGSFAVGSLRVSVVDLPGLGPKDSDLVLDALDLFGCVGTFLRVTTSFLAVF